MNQSADYPKRVDDCLSRVYEYKCSCFIRQAPGILSKKNISNVRNLINRRVVTIEVIISGWMVARKCSTSSKMSYLLDLWHFFETGARLDPRLYRSCEELRWEWFCVLKSVEIMQMQDRVVASLPLSFLIYRSNDPIILGNSPFWFGEIDSTINSLSQLFVLFFFLKKCTCILFSFRIFSSRSSLFARNTYKINYCLPWCNSMR